MSLQDPTAKGTLESVQHYYFSEKGARKDEHFDQGYDALVRVNKRICGESNGKN